MSAHCQEQGIDVVSDEERIRIARDALRNAGVGTAEAMSAFVYALREFDQGWIGVLQRMDAHFRCAAVAAEALKEHMLAEK